MEDVVDRLLVEWGLERPELDCQALSIVVRVQLLAKVLGQSAERALSPLQLKLWEYDVLSALRRQGPPYQLPAQELARASMLTSGTVTNRIDRLEAKGLVRRAVDPADRRGVNVRLTAAGRRLIDRALEARLKAAEDQLGALETAERQSVSSGLRKLLATQAAQVAESA